MHRSGGDPDISKAWCSYRLFRSAVLKLVMKTPKKGMGCGAEKWTENETGTRKTMGVYCGAACWTKTTKGLEIDASSACNPNPRTTGPGLWRCMHTISL